MKVKITRPTRADGKSLEVDKVYDLNEKDAKQLMLMGKAVDPDGKPKKAEKLSTENAGALTSGEK